MGELDQGQCFRLPLKGQFTLLRTSFHPEKEVKKETPKKVSKGKETHEEPLPFTDPASDLEDLELLDE